MMPRNPTKKKSEEQSALDRRGPTGRVPFTELMPELKPIEEQPPVPKVQVIERRIETVVVEIPLGEPPHRFQTIHLEALLYGEHAQTWARLRQALRDKDSRTADGKEVRSGPDIVRWLLEQFASE